MKNKESVFLVGIGVVSTLLVGGLIYFFTGNNQDKHKPTKKGGKSPDFDKLTNLLDNITPENLGSDKSIISFVETPTQPINLNINNATVNVFALYQMVDMAVRDRMAPILKDYETLSRDHKLLSAKLEISNGITRKLIKEIATDKKHQADISVNLVDLILTIVTNKPYYKEEKQLMMTETFNESISKFINLFSFEEQQSIREEMDYLQALMQQKDYEVFSFGELTNSHYAEDIS
jgi:predicted metalloendopeptidase